MNSLSYDSRDNIIYHFYQHVVFGLSSNIPRFDQRKNWKEKLGDLGLWAIENFPGKIRRLMEEPRWVTIVLTNLSMAAVTYGFYPRESTLLLKAIWIKMPVPSRETVKFAVYLTIIAQIVSAAFRAYGRFSNDSLMQAWYTNGAHQEDSINREETERF